MKVAASQFTGPWKLITSSHFYAISPHMISLNRAKGGNYLDPSKEMDTFRKCQSFRIIRW